MIKRIGLYILNKLQVLIPESILVYYAKRIFDKKDKSLITLIIRNCFSERYKNATAEEKKKLGLLVWRSKGAAHYFKNRTHSEKIINKFTGIIQKNNNFDVCEIGTGNGNLMSILSKSYPNNNFYGIDLSDEQIKINRVVYKTNPKIHFITADILEYIQNNIKNPTIYISYVSLTTFTPEMVNDLFKYIAERKTPSIIVIYEPIESNKADGENSIIRSGLAYAHNYITIAKQNGFTTIDKLSTPPFFYGSFIKN